MTQQVATPQNSDSFGKVWAYGIKEPGWYVAKWMWDEGYANHLRSLGYTVLSSVNKPERMPA